MYNDTEVVKLKVSYSRISVYNECPFKYRLVYLEHLEPLDDFSPGNALYVGTAAHEAVEKRSVEAGIESYKSHFKELGPEHEFEIEKLKIMSQKAIDQIPECETYEYKLEVPDEFVGFIDGLKKNDDGTYTIMDFKTSNNVAGYRNSPQVHLYKYYFERLTGNKVKDLYYVFIPKPTIKLNESLSNKEEILEELSNMNVHFEKVEYDRNQVNYFFARKTLLEKAKAFPKRPNRFCKWCDFYRLCTSNGTDLSELKESSIKKLES